MTTTPAAPNVLYFPHLDTHIPPNSHVTSLPNPPFTTKLAKFLKRKYNVGSIKYSLSQIVPAVNLFKKPYSLTDLWVDALAGVTLSTVLIPQSLSYAILAGLTAQYGLYSAFIAPLLYFLFGTTRELSVGPFALVSIIMAQIINTMYPSLLTDETLTPELAFEMRLSLTMALTFAAGVWLIIMAVCKLGWIIDMVSGPGVDGLIMATALSVSASQLGTLFGISTGQGSFLHCIIGLFRNIADTNFVSLIVGSLGIALLIVSDLYTAKKKLKVPLPSQIGLVFVATLFSALFSFEDNFHVKVVGEIPMGFLPSVLPNWTELFTNINFWINGFMVAVVCFVISISVSQQMSQENKYKVNFNSELFALGACSFVGAFFNCYTSSASLSRTTVVNSCKPRSQIWSLWSSLILLCVILFLGPLLYYLPMCVLSSVVIGAFRSQFLKWDQFLVYWKQSPRESLVYLCTLLVTLLVSVQAGLVTAFASSLFSVILDQAGFTPTFLVQIPNCQRFVHYHRLPLSPYYTFLDEIEGQGGLSKRKQPRGSAKYRKYDDAEVDPSTDLAGLGSTAGNTTDYGDESGSESDHHAAPKPFDFQFHSHDDHNQPSHNPNIPHSAHHGVVNGDSGNNDISINVHKDTQQNIVLTDPRVVVLHFGKQITFLNSNPISEYITRYIEMFQEYKNKKSQLLPNNLKHYLQSTQHSPSPTSTPSFRVAANNTSQNTTSTSEITSPSSPPRPDSDLLPDVQSSEHFKDQEEGSYDKYPTKDKGKLHKSPSLLHNSRNYHISSTPSDLHDIDLHNGHESTANNGTISPLKLNELEIGQHGERRLDGACDDDYLPVAPQILQQTLLDPAINTAFKTLPFGTLNKNKMLLSSARLPAQAPNGDSSSGGDSDLMQSYHNLYASDGRNSIMSPHIQHSNHASSVVDPYDMNLEDDDAHEDQPYAEYHQPKQQQQTNPNLPHNHNQSIQLTNAMKSLSTLSTLSHAQKVRFLPPSPSTASTLPQILFTSSTFHTTPQFQQGMLFTTMVHDTVTNLTPEQISKYEMIIILDQIMGVDLTGRSMLKKLAAQYPFVLFLYTTPSINLINHHLNSLTIPSNFINHNIYITVEFAKYFLDMSIAARIYQTRVDQGMQ